MAKIGESLVDLNRKLREKPASQVSFGNCETHVAFVLDSSGSMDYVKEEAMKGFNSQLAVIRQRAEHNVRTHLTLFGTPDGIDYELVNAEVGDLKDLTHGTYHPYGGTPLLDAVCMTIDSVKTFDRRDPQQAFLVIVVSDGQENDSQRYTWRDLRHTIEALMRNGRWTFVFIGPFEEHPKFQQAGVPEENLLEFNGSVEETLNAFAESAGGLGRFLTARNEGRLLTAGFFEQKKGRKKR